MSFTTTKSGILHVSVDSHVYVIVVCYSMNQAVECNSISLLTRSKPEIKKNVVH